MSATEWPLVVFTLLSQMGAGAFLVMAAARYLPGWQARPDRGARPNPRFLLCLAGLLAVANVVAFFHLGNPLNAQYALGNLRTSWLSREILCAAAFTTIIVILGLLEWRNVRRMNRPIVLIAVITAIAFIFSMSKVYMLPTVPVWNTHATMVSFFLVTFLLGGMFFSCAHRGISFRPTLILSLILLFLNIVLAVLFLRDFSHPASIWRPALLMTAAALLTLSVRRGKAAAADRGLVYTAFLFALAAEVIGRYLFYTVYNRVGL